MSFAEELSKRLEYLSKDYDADKREIVLLGIDLLKEDNHEWI